jgi:DNA-binding beta-propeller fold protein YncE
MRRALWDIWYNRDYKRYDEVTQKKHTLDNWPLVHDFRLYVRKDISSLMWDQRIGPALAAQLPSDPYTKGRRDVTALQIIGAGGAEKGQLNAPHGLAVAPDGSLYVADSNNHRIQKFDPYGVPVLSFGSFSGANNNNPPPGTFNEPWGVAVGPDGSVYVADTWNHRIQKFDADGKFLKAWGTPGQTDAAAGLASVFWGPRAVAVGKDGRVYVTDTGNKRVAVFSAEGVFLSQFGGAGVQPGQFDEPVGLAVDPAGNLVVNDTWNQRIQVFAPDGQPLRQWEVKGWADQGVTNKPYVAADAAGNVYTVDPTTFRVLVFTAEGAFKATFGDIGTDDKSFQLPVGIAVDKDGSVYVSDASLNRVLKFAPIK